MSSLGLSLLILIVVAIGALAAYNFWLTRKPGAKSGDFETGFSSSASTRQEPSFSSGTTEPYAPEPANPDVEPMPMPAATSFGPAPVPADAGQETAGAEPPAKSEAMPEWAAGVLPDAPPAPPPPPDLNWQSGPTTESKSSAQAGDESSFEASIEQAMRLQREADDLIETETGKPSDGMSADAPPSVESTDSPLTWQKETDSNDSGASSSNEDASGSPESSGDSLSDGAAEGEGRGDTLPAMEASELPAELPAEALTDSLPSTEPAAPDKDPADEAVADEGYLQSTQETVPASAPTPGWSGIDSDRQAANFVTTVNIELGGPTKGAELIARTRELTHAGTKPIRITAGNPPAAGQSVIRTESIDPGRDYALLRVELLQVNRHGPLDGVEYSSFVAAVDAIGESLGVLVNPPDMNVVLIKSRVLDAEVASLDAQVAVNVETEDPIPVEKFASLAEELGLTKLNVNEENGAYASSDDGGYVIYTAQLNAEANRIVLVLDVPAVPRELQPVRKMVEGAWGFAQALNGQMIDDNGRAIDNALFERIESQIETHYQALLAAGVPAGSDLARQVYNQI